MEPSHTFSMPFPTAELHRHLEGSIRLETLKEIAIVSSTTQDIPKGDEDRYWRSIFHITEPVATLTEFLDRFWAVQKCISSYEIIERITYEMIEDCYKEGTRILEIRYSPAFIQLNHGELTFEGIHEAIVRGKRRAQDKYSIAVGIIGIVDRNLQPYEASIVNDFIMSNSNSIIGMDLANDELLFDSKPFAEYFRNAKRKGLHITVHAGESLVSNKYAENVKEAIELLGAERIGHGIAISLNDDIINYVNKNNVVLEVCPSSNYLIGAVQSLDKHPIRKLVNSKVKVTVSTDDPGVFGHLTLPNEFDILANRLNFSQEEILECNNVAISASFINEQDKQRALQGKFV